MAEFPSKVSTRTSSPAQGAGASGSLLRPDPGFVRSRLGALMLLQLVSARGPRGAGRGGSGAPGGHPQPRLARAPTRRAAPGGAARTEAPESGTPAPRHLESPCCGRGGRARRAQVFGAQRTAPPPPPPGGHQSPPRPESLA